jgi:hypothetical protein
MDDNCGAVVSGVGVGIGVGVGVGVGAGVGVGVGEMITSVVAETTLDNWDTFPAGSEDTIAA